METFVDHYYTFENEKGKKMSYSKIDVRSF